MRTGKFTGECFIYTNAANRLQYVIGEQTYTIRPCDTELYVLGYLPQLGRVFAADKDMGIYSFALSLSVVEYQTAILQGDYARAEQLLPSIPAAQRSKVAKFLESHELRELALQVAVDPDHRFDLAVSLGQFDVALKIAAAAPASGAETRWRTLGDRALQRWNVALAQSCFEKANDLNSLLLIASAKRDAALLAHVGAAARARGEMNLAFAALLQTGDVRACVEVLRESDRVPEAAMFARTYAPSLVPELVEAWRASLAAGKSQKQAQIAETIGDPVRDAAAFEEDWQAAVAQEETLRPLPAAVPNGSVPAAAPAQPAGWDEPAQPAGWEQPAEHTGWGEPQEAAAWSAEQPAAWPSEQAADPAARGELDDWGEPVSAEPPAREPSLLD